jgi:2-polyprenyl-6-methoxyphenol hydroxylase and related FAD-dependent oxidoreductases
MQLWLNVRAPAEGGHRQVKEWSQRAQNRLQRYKLTKRHQVVLIITVGGVVAVFAVFAERNDGVVGVITVLLIQSCINNPGNQRTAACAQQIVHHVSKRSHFDNVALNELLNFLKTQHFEQRVIQRTQVRVNLLAEIAWQEAQFFTGLYRRAGQQDTANILTLQCINGSGNRQIGFTCTRRTYTEGDVMADNFIMQSGMDLFYAGFSNDLGPVRILRNIGLMAAERAGGLKRQALKYALGL